jgi:hypothetical protein
METLCPSVQSSGEAVRDELTLGGILRAFLPLLLHLCKQPSIAIESFDNVICVG